MIDTFQNLTTIAACDAYVNECGREKTAQENRKNNLSARLQNDNVSSDIEERIEFLAQRIQSQQDLIASNPPEEDLRDLQISLGDLIKDRAILERKFDQVGQFWKNETIREINRCDYDIVALDAQITALNTYRATLAA